jgi:transcriptional regulator of acetoin/glycerol metabolism
LGEASREKVVATDSDTTAPNPVTTCIASLPELRPGQSAASNPIVNSALSMCRSPVIKVNCAPVNGKFLDSELFGYVKGTFSNAGCSKIGRFEAAHEVTFWKQINKFGIDIHQELAV